MKRTRKWAFVAQEATRLAALGLSPKDIATRLNVDKSSVTRWMRTGKLATTRDDRRPVKVAAPKKTTPEQWAAAVRAAYDLDATDEQLVALAVEALKMSRDLAIGPQARMTAAGRFQAIVKQLRLIAREQAAAPTAPPETPKRKTFEVRRRSNTDPRTLLTAVK